MGIRWRLAVLALQLVVLAVATQVATGQLVSEQTWFLAGLLAVVVNKQLLEPRFAGPQQVLGNSLLGLALFALSPRTVAGLGWRVFVVFIAVAAGTAFLALVLGAGRSEGRGVTVGRAGRTVSSVASAGVIYSTVFWLSLVEHFSVEAPQFWTLGSAWAVIMFLGVVNWQVAWSAASGRQLPCTPEAMLGPSVLLVSSPVLPPSGSIVRLIGGSRNAAGVVITRITRTADAWAEIYVEDAESCEELVQNSSLRIELDTTQQANDFVGFAGPGSSDRSLRFVSTEPLQVGGVVTVAEGSAQVLYQLVEAHIDRSSAKGGAHLVVQVRAAQLGAFDPQSWSIRRHAWVPSPGAAVRKAPPEAPIGTGQPPDNWVKLGDVIGTRVPVFVDLKSLCEGHVAILGMTRMGKTSIAARLIDELATDRRVTVMDQTGEYIGKRQWPRYAEDHDREPRGVSVFEPNRARTAAEQGVELFERMIGIAAEEYDNGTPSSRVLVIDEAHQFIPEPAGLSFNDPSRDSAIRFGLLMMQVRKYGVSIVLISQRTAVVSKSALSQCENLIAFKNVDRTGLEYLEAILGSDTRELLPKLEQGQAFVFGPAFSSDAPVAIQLDHAAPDQH